MRESVKSVLALFLIVSTIAAVLGWYGAVENAPDWVNPTLKYGCTPFSVVTLYILLAMHFKRDKVPDFLYSHAKNYFNRDGFCFTATAVSNEGICYLHVLFQNQFSKNCVGHVAFRPGQDFYLGRAKFDTVAAKIECGPGAFGVAKIPIPVKKTLQGKKKWFEVGASVTYPDGKGERLRYRDGLFLRANTNFGNSFSTGLMVAGAMTGSIVLSSPAKVLFYLPIEVAEDLEDSLSTEVEILWQLGDPLPGIDTHSRNDG